MADNATSGNPKAVLAKNVNPNNISNGTVAKGKAAKVGKPDPAKASKGQQVDTQNTRLSRLVELLANQNAMLMAAYRNGGMLPLQAARNEQVLDCEVQITKTSTKPQVATEMVWPLSLDTKLSPKLWASLLQGLDYCYIAKLANNICETNQPITIAALLKCLQPAKDGISCFSDGQTELRLGQSALQLELVKLEKRIISRPETASGQANQPSINQLGGLDHKHKAKSTTDKGVIPPVNTAVANASQSNKGNRYTLPAPARFTGKTDKSITCPRTWLNLLREYLSCVGQNFLECFPHHVEGAAQTWVAGLYKTIKGTKYYTEENVCKEFLLQYGDALRPEEVKAREKLHSGDYRMHKGESYGLYVQNFRQLMREAGDMATLDQISWFIEGLTPALKSACAVQPNGK
jgi:hypothetical protein